MKKEDLKVGEYIRTKAGYIAKIIDNSYCLTCDSTIVKRFGEELDFLSYQEEFDTITKHSMNIIDVLEREDLLNGYILLDEYYDDDDNEVLAIPRYDEEDSTYVIGYDILTKDFEINSILTHEQYDKNCYKLEE